MKTFVMIRDFPANLARVMKPRQRSNVNPCAPVDLNTNTRSSITAQAACEIIVVPNLPKKKPAPKVYWSAFLWLSLLKLKMPRYLRKNF